MTSKSDRRKNGYNQSLFCHYVSNNNSHKKQMQDTSKNNTYN